MATSLWSRAPGQNRAVPTHDSTLRKPPLRTAFLEFPQGLACHARFWADCRQPLPWDYFRVARRWGTIAKMPELATSSLCQFTSQTPSGSSSLASSGPRVVPYLFLSTHRIFWQADLFKPMLWDFSDIGSRWHRQRDK